MAPQVTAFPITVPYDELQGSPMETDALMHFEATRSLRLAWVDRLTLADQLLTGYVINLGPDCDGSPVISRMGQVYPYRNGVFADTCQIKPFGSNIGAVNGNTSLAGYEWAQVDVHYKPFPFDPTFGNFLAEESIRLSSQVVSVPGQLYWGDMTPLDSGEKPTRINRILEWSVSFRQLLNVPSCWLNTAQCVNDSDVTSPLLRRVFGAESLLYHGPDVTRVVGENAQQYWNVTLRFSHLVDASGSSSGVSWNYVLRGADPGASFTSPVPQPVYTGSDFTAPSTVPGGITEFKQYTPINFPSVFFL